MPCKGTTPTIKSLNNVILVYTLITILSHKHWFIFLQKKQKQKQTNNVLYQYRTSEFTSLYLVEC